MDDVLPQFTVDDVLPVGDYPLTIAELRQSRLVTGQGNPSRTWDSAWRGQLVENLAIMTAQLWAVGITEIFVDGSFVENRDHPGDIDGYFVIDPTRLSGRQLEQELNRLDLTKYGHGTGDGALYHLQAAKRNCPCGCNVGLSYSRTSLDYMLGFWTSSATSRRSLSRFANPASLRRKASSRCNKETKP